MTRRHDAPSKIIKIHRTTPTQKVPTCAYQVILVEKISIEILWTAKKCQEEVLWNKRGTFSLAYDESVFDSPCHKTREVAIQPHLIGVCGWKFLQQKLRPRGVGWRPPSSCDTESRIQTRHRQEHMCLFYSNVLPPNISWRCAISRWTFFQLIQPGSF